MMEWAKRFWREQVIGDLREDAPPPAAIATVDDIARVPDAEPVIAEATTAPPAEAPELERMTVSPPAEKKAPTERPPWMLERILETTPIPPDEVRRVSLWLQHFRVPYRVAKAASLRPDDDMTKAEFMERLMIPEPAVRS